MRSAASSRARRGGELDPRAVMRARRAFRRRVSSIEIPSEPTTEVGCDSGEYAVAATGIMWACNPRPDRACEAQPGGTTPATSQARAGQDCKRCYHKAQHATERKSVSAMPEARSCDTAAPSR